MKKVAIIGSGLAGLVAGAGLAKNGYAVTVFEQHYIPGGYATLFRRKYIRFEVSLHLIGDLLEGGMVKKMLQELGVIPEVKFHQMDILYKSVFPDQDVLATNYDDYLERLTNMYPDEKEALATLFKLFFDIRKEIILISTKSQKGEIINPAYDTPLISMFQDYSLKELLDERFSDDKLKAIISQYWQYFAVPPSKMSALLYAYAWTEYFVYGGFYPEDRSQNISDRLVEIIVENSGEVKLKSRVDKILIEEKTAKGVALETGEVYRADIVISNANLNDTFEKMVGYEYIPKRHLNKILKVEPSISNIQVYLYLDIDFAKVYGEPIHELFINDGYDMENTYQNVLDGRVEDAAYGITIYENIIKDYNHKPGYTTISLFQLSLYEHWTGLNPMEYRQKKEYTLNVLLGRLEERYKGIREHIVFSDISTPVTNERYTGNPGGAIYGAAQTVNQVMHRRTSQKTPVKNLFLAGAWTRPGAGYSGTIWSGYNVTRAILRTFKEEKDVQG